MRLLIQEMIHSLRGAGWSIANVACDDPDQRVWIVFGVRGSEVIRARGATAAEAWYEACRHARTMGALLLEPGICPHFPRKCN